MAYAEVADLDDHLGDTKSRDPIGKQRALDSATAVIDSWTGRRFTLDAAPSARSFNSCGTLLITDDFVSLDAVYPEISIGVIGDLIDPTIYRPLPLNAPVYHEPYNCIEGVYGWGVFSVTATWGWPSVPAAVTQACLMKAARIYKRRESVTGVVGLDEFGPIRIGRDDADVTDLLSPYKFIYVG